MSDVMTAWLRTIVPALWATGVAWLITRVPGLSALVDPLDGFGYLVAVPLVLAAWKAVLTKVELVLPSWLAAALLGAAAMPVYVRPSPSITPVHEAP